MDLAPIDLFAKISFRKGAGGGWGRGGGEAYKFT